MKHRNNIKWGVVLTCALTGLTVAPSLTQPARAQQAAPITIGVVDEGKIGEGYKRYRDALTAIDRRAQTLQEQLLARFVLNDTEAKRFDELIAKDARTAPETTELTTLVRTGTARQTEYQDLQGKANRSEQDVARMKVLQDLAQGNQIGTQRIEDALLSKIKKDQDDAETKYLAEAKTVIGRIATARKLTLVLSMRAVAWNLPAVDITNEVLAQLNK